MPGVKITGFGAYAPDRVVSNKELAVQLNSEITQLAKSGSITEDDLIRCGIIKEREELTPEGVLGKLTTTESWIEERGIRERHVAASNQATSDLAVEAIKRCFLISGYYPMDESYLLLATVLGDFQVSPPTTPIIQHKMGWPVKWSDGRLIDRLTMDVTAACSSFLAALVNGEALIRSGNRRGGYVVGADIMSRTYNISYFTVSVK